MMSSYNWDNHHFSAPVWGGQNPQSPTTGAHQYAAGSGQHTARVARSHEIRAAYDLPVMTSPLQNIQPFVDEFERDDELNRRSVARSAVEGAVLGAGLMYALRRNRARR